MHARLAKLAAMATSRQSLLERRCLALLLGFNVGYEAGKESKDGMWVGGPGSESSVHTFWIASRWLWIDYTALYLFLFLFANHDTQFILEIDL